MLALTIKVLMHQNVKDTVLACRCHTESNDASLNTKAHIYTGEVNVNRA